MWAAKERLNVGKHINEVINATGQRMNAAMLLEQNTNATTIQRIICHMTVYKNPLCK